MLCEKCQKKKATLYYNENINGKRRSFHLCSDCASAMEASGELEELSTLFPCFDSPLSLCEAVFPHVSVTPAPPVAAADRTCPSCGSSFKEITTLGRVGCPRCYEAFAAELDPLIRALHGDRPHGGSLPRLYRQRAQREARVSKLRAQLKEAVATEAYEQAAVLRDELRRLESGQ